MLILLQRPYEWTGDVNECVIVWTNDRTKERMIEVQNVWTNYLINELMNLVIYYLINWLLNCWFTFLLTYLVNSWTNVKIKWLYYIVNTCIIHPRSHHSNDTCNQKVIMLANNKTLRFPVAFNFLSFHINRVETASDAPHSHPLHSSGFAYRIRHHHRSPDHDI